VKRGCDAPSERRTSNGLFDTALALKAQPPHAPTLAAMDAGRIGPGGVIERVSLDDKPDGGARRFVAMLQDRAAKRAQTAVQPESLAFQCASFSSATRSMAT
jgi:glucan biosynthesis protein